MMSSRPGSSAAEEELPFAGHPVIGAAAAVHERLARLDVERSWVFVIAGRKVDVASQRKGDYCAAAMSQGQSHVVRAADHVRGCGFRHRAEPGRERPFGLPMQVVSTRPSSSFRSPPAA